jgi:hypothetical protein
MTPARYRLSATASITVLVAVGLLFNTQAMGGELNYVSRTMYAHAYSSNTIDNPGTLTLSSELGSFSRHAEVTESFGNASITMQVTRAPNSLSFDTTAFYNAALGQGQDIGARGEDMEVFDLTEPTTLQVTITKDQPFVYQVRMDDVTHNTNIFIEDMGTGADYVIPLQAGRYSLHANTSVGFNAPTRHGHIQVTVVPEPASLVLAAAAFALMLRPRHLPSDGTELLEPVATPSNERQHRAAR